MKTNKNQTLTFNGKYVNGKAKDVLKDFSKNTHVTKGTTGLGGTHSVLNKTDECIIIISPNIGMIKSKENLGKSYDSDKQLFIYSKSNDTWKDVETYLDNILPRNQNLIINTTAEQVLKIKSMNSGLYNQLTPMHVFVDEIHAFTQDSSYRKSLGEFMELVINQWQGNFKVSTATPIYYNLDMPENMNIQHYRLERENQPIRPVMVSPKLQHYKEFVYREQRLGRKVVVFSNNIDVHKDFRDLRVANLVGNNLMIKLLPFGRGISSENLDYDLYDVFILSSSYFAGFDFEHDCSICVVSEQRNEAYKINILNFVQAYGRCRHEVHNALYINTTAKKDRNFNEIHYPKTQYEVDNIATQYKDTLKKYQSKVNGNYYFGSDINKELITQDNYINRLMLLTKPLGLINDYHQYNQPIFNQTLRSYGFEVLEYESTNEKYTTLRSVNFKERLQNIAELPTLDLHNSFKDILKGLKYKDEGSFTYDLALVYLTVLLLKLSDAEVILDKLQNKTLKPNEFYHTVDLYLRSNVDTSYYFNQLSQNQADYGNANYMDANASLMLNCLKDLTDNWQMLYAIYRFKKTAFPEHIDRVISIYELTYDIKLHKSLLEDTDHRNNRACNAIFKALKSLNITPDSNERNWIKERSKKLFKDLKAGKDIYSYSRKSIVNNLIESIGFLIAEGKGNHRPKDIKNREYYPLIRLPRELRSLIPIKYLIIDLDSANAQIVDSLIGSDISLNIYDNLMTAFEITRDEAKQLYNKMLNRHYSKRLDAIEFYRNCGYTNEQSIRLARLTSRVKKGEFYQRLTENEKVLVKNYADILVPTCHRFHDAVVVKMESVECTHLGLPLKVKGYSYHINLFNDGSEYYGIVYSD
ncbi:hypothetical protein [Seonamhaeicola maritimus]|uniref:Uncharacterized protein n=1 Tax=Seonamhaeicola maritimus TaxID=2591822 RepID=A0A5C7GGJ3_9FLAO|nr:hypothetical protein [Seonamhaeicola maritimus]TXG36724.1 hypothetical protein FUA22_09075 [Seonamhaeicola maritimus]